MVFTVIHAIEAVVWYLVLGNLAGAARTWLNRPRVRQTIVAVTGAVFAFFGLRIATELGGLTSGWNVPPTRQASPAWTRQRVNGRRTGDREWVGEHSRFTPANAPGLTGAVKRTDRAGIPIMMKSDDDLAIPSAIPEVVGLGGSWSRCEHWCGCMGGDRQPW